VQHQEYFTIKINNFATYQRFQVLHPHCGILVVGYGLNSGHDSVDDTSVLKSLRSLPVIVSWKGLQLMVGGVVNQSLEHEFLWEQQKFQQAVARTRHSQLVSSPDFGAHFARTAQHLSPLPTATPSSHSSQQQLFVPARQFFPLLMSLLLSGL
jgi:hypothetical protein